MADRLAILREGLSRDQSGIEIAPWARPIVAKRDGWRVLTIDIFPTERLVAAAIADPSMGEALAAGIEPVDIVGPAQEIGRFVEERGLSGEIDYVLSSHNFEHLPDPVTFLHGCERALKPGGRLILAVPDLRCCFDYFRPHSTTSAILAAHRERRTVPPPEAWLDQNLLGARMITADLDTDSFFLAAEPDAIVPNTGVEEAYETWLREADGSAAYRDTHCWTFTPSSLALILHDLAFMGLSTLVADPPIPTDSNEFYIRLTNRPGAPRAQREAFYARRAELLRAIKDEAAAASHLARDPGRERAPPQARRRWRRALATIGRGWKAA